MEIWRVQLAQRVLPLHYKSDGLRLTCSEVHRTGLTPRLPAGKGRSDWFNGN
jgi:hypothetical protein